MHLLLDQELKLCLTSALEGAVGAIEFDHILPVLGKDGVVTHLELLLEVVFLEVHLSHLQSLVVDS